MESGQLDDQCKAGILAETIAMAATGSKVRYHNSLVYEYSKPKIGIQPLKIKFYENWDKFKVISESLDTSRLTIYLAAFE